MILGGEHDAWGCRVGGECGDDVEICELGVLREEFVDAFCWLLMDLTTEFGGWRRHFGEDAMGEESGSQCVWWGSYMEGGW